MIFFGPLSFISHNHKELSSVKEFLCEMTMDSIRLVGFETKCLFLVALPTTGPPTTYPYFGLLMELNFPSRPIRSTSHSLRSPSNPIWGLNVSLHQRERDSVSSTSQFFLRSSGSGGNVRANKVPSFSSSRRNGVENKGT